MQLTSERLTFHKCTESDLADFRELVMREEVMKYITGKALSSEEANERFNNNLKTNAEDPYYGFFMARSKEHNGLMGYGKLVRYEEGQYEVGYSLHPDHWGRGYATEILEALIVYAKKDPAIKELVAMITPANTASRKVLEKKNFVSFKIGMDEKGGTEYFRLALK